MYVPLLLAKVAIYSLSHHNLTLKIILTNRLGSYDFAQCKIIQRLWFWLVQQDLWVVIPAIHKSLRYWNRALAHDLLFPVGDRIGDLFAGMGKQEIAIDKPNWIAKPD